MLSNIISLLEIQFYFFILRMGVMTSGGGSEGISGTVSSTAAALEEQLRLSKLENRALK